MIGRLSAAKNLDTRICVKGKVNNYVSEMLDMHKERINNYAKLHDVKVKIAQRDDNSMLINSGVLTSRLDFKKMESAREFLWSIIDNIRANSRIKEGKALGKEFLA